MSTVPTWFTATRMKNTAIAIVTFDILLLAMWIGGAGYISFNFCTDCFHDAAIFHYFILVHFILAATLAAMVGEITKEQRLFERETGRQLARLPYHIYLPLSWILASILSFSGDLFLLVWACLEYRKPHTDECDNARIFHITLDSFALLASLISIIWFVVFSIHSIREERLAVQQL